jgi:fructosamine-3-kinase
MFHELAAKALRLAGDTTQLHAQTPVGGGSIGQAFRLRTERGDYLLKLDGRGLPGFAAAEARGLALLAATRAVRVPAVLAYHDAESTADERPPASLGNTPRPVAGRGSSGVGTSFILLEWLAAPPQTDQAAVAEVLGSQLAALHRATAPAYGLDHDNYIGATPQPNGWMPSWLAFFRERRLGFQAQLARQNGHLRGERAQRMEHLLDRLGEWIDDHTTQPALLHGDLWGGNFIVGPGGAPALVDPAAYHGDREADLAMTRLFGGFPASFYRAYESAWPLPAGWQDRVDLYNLYHLLNHLNLFGEGYGAQVDAVLRRYVG